MNSLGQTQIHEVRSIPDRLQLIAKQIDTSAHQPLIRKVALEQVAGTPQHGSNNEPSEISAVFWYVKTNIEYRQDPRDYDYYPTAMRTIEMGGEDCDGHTILVCSLLNNLGFQTGAKVISQNGVDWHIYPMACYDTKMAPTKKIALDTTQPESTPGWEPPRIHHRHVYEAAFSEGIAYINKER